MTATVSSRLFLRKAQLVVGVKQSEASSNVEPTDGILFQTRLNFQVDKTTESASNKAKITIYNINQESRNFLEQKDLIVFLKAGFEDSVSTIFVGDVIKAITKRQGPDVTITLECGDKEVILRKAHVEIGLGAGATNIQVFERAAAKLFLTIPSRQKAQIPVKQFLKGFSFSGTVKSLMDQFTKQINYEWNIQDGELQILPKSKATTQEAVLLTPQTGLIGFPTKTEKGYQFISILNPEIRPGRAIKLQSKQFEGALATTPNTVASSSLDGSGVTLKCKKATFKGDTSEGDWVVEVEGIVPK